jgi:ribonuclease HI
MELRAAIEALKALTAPCQVILYSDSSYVVNCFRDRWYEAWRQNGWQTKKKQSVANRELWEELVELADKLGRTSNSHESYNQRCDRLAVAAIAAG